MVDHGPGPWLTMVDDGQIPWLTMGKDHGQRTKKSKIQFKTQVAFISGHAMPIDICPSIMTDMQS